METGDVWLGHKATTGISRLFERFLPKRGAGRDVAVLSGSTAIGQLLSVLASPILTRLYTPDDFGILGVLSAILGIVTVVASLRYQLAIPLPDDDVDATQVLAVSSLSVVLVTISSALLIWLSGPRLVVWFGVPLKFLWIVPISVAFVGLYQVFYYWSIRTNSFGAIARTRVSQSAFMLIIQLIGSALGAFGLVVGHVAGQMMGLTTLGVQALRGGRLRLQDLSLSGIISLAGRYRRFPLISTWSGLFNTLGMQLPPLLIVSLFGISAGGVYNLAHRVANVPAQLAGRAIGDVFLSRGAVAYREGRLGKLVGDAVQYLVALGLPPLAVLMFVAPSAFVWVFGDNWREAGVIVQYMVPWIFVVFIASPLTALFSIMERQAEGAVFQLVLLLSRVLALVVGARIGDFRAAVTIYAMASALSWTGFLLWSLQVTGNSARAFVAAVTLSMWRLSPAVVILLGARVFAEIRSSDGILMFGLVLAILWVVRYYWRFMAFPHLKTIGLRSI